MNPNASHSSMTFQSRRYSAHAFAEARPVFLQAHQLHRPPRQGQDRNAGQQQAVKNVHGRPNILFAPPASCENSLLRPIIRAVKTFRIAALFLFLVAAGLCGDKGFNPPPAGAAASYPLHEAHDDEKATIAIDPFTSPEKAAVFKTHYGDYGFLP